MGEKENVTTMVLKVDLQCDKCYKKVKKVLCEFPEIRDQTYDEKQNQVVIKVVSSSPEKIRDKIRCKGGCAIKSIEIKKPDPKPPTDTKKPPTDTKKPPTDNTKNPPPVQVNVCCTCIVCSQRHLGGTCYRGSSCGNIWCYGFCGRPVCDSSCGSCRGCSEPDSCRGGCAIKSIEIKKPDKPKDTQPDQPKNPPPVQVNVSCNCMVCSQGHPCGTCYRGSRCGNIWCDGFCGRPACDSSCGSCRGGFTSPDCCSEEKPSACRRPTCDSSCGSYRGCGTRPDCCSEEKPSACRRSTCDSSCGGSRGCSEPDSCRVM